MRSTFFTNFWVHKPITASYRHHVFHQTSGTYSSCIIEIFHPLSKLPIAPSPQPLASTNSTNVTILDTSSK